MTGTGAIQPQQLVWVGDLADLARPPEAVSPGRHACCGGCYPSYIECVDPMLRTLVTAVARTICPHRDTDLLCSSCGLRVLMLTERVRNTWRFSLEGPTWWKVTLAILLNHGLLTPEDGSRLQVIYTASEQRGWGGALAEDALEVLLRSQNLSDMTAHRVIDSYFPVASATSTWSNQPLEPVQPRTSPSFPPRKWYHRAELEMAQAQGWPEPQRFMLERRIRTAARKAWSEADFVRNLLADGLAAFPRLSTSGFGVCGYSVADPGIPASLRTTFAGASLAPDLTLPRLRRAWDSAPEDEDAWATWVSLAVPAVIDADPLQPAVPADGGWRWVHPSLQRQPVTTDTSAWPAGSRPPRPVVWEVLLARQAGRCAMCSIRRYHWERVYESAVPEGLLAEPAHVDHDHDTGLVRGLLCAYCNTVREPWEAGFRGDVWSTYVAEPPAAPYGWQFYAQPRR